MTPSPYEYLLSTRLAPETQWAPESVQERYFLSLSIKTRSMKNWRHCKSLFWAGGSLYRVLRNRRLKHWGHYLSYWCDPSHLTLFQVHKWFYPTKEHSLGKQFQISILSNQIKYQNQNNSVAYIYFQLDSMIKDSIQI